MHGADRRRSFHRNEVHDIRATLRRMPIQAQVGLRGKSERAMNERKGFCTLPCCNRQSSNVSSDALPPAAVVLTVKVRSVAKRRR